MAATGKRGTQGGGQSTGARNFSLWGLSTQQKGTIQPQGAMAGQASHAGGPISVSGLPHSPQLGQKRLSQNLLFGLLTPQLSSSRWWAT